VLTAIAFDKTGEFLSVGDRGGRVIIFKRSRQKKKSRVDEFDYFNEFQSHEPGFDYLKSTEIEEKINSIEWINNESSPLGLLTCNDKSIKLWKLKCSKKNVYSSARDALQKKGKLAIPKLKNS
jgi:serine/threonine-protein phosphatase 2A regulatory subunit B